MTDVIEQLNSVFRKVFNDSSISLAATTTARDIEAWDSLAHIQLIVAIEKHFKIRFTSLEIQNFKNVGEISETIAKKLVA